MKVLHFVFISVQWRQEERNKRAGRKNEKQGKWSGKRKSAQRAEYRRTDQWEHFIKGLFRYRDTARQADLQATRRWQITGHQIIISRCDRGAAWKASLKKKISKLYWRYVQRRHNRIIWCFEGRDNPSPYCCFIKKCPAAYTAGLSVLSFYSSSISSSAICTALVAAPLRTWSPQHQRLIPFWFTRSRRILPT